MEQVIKILWRNKTGSWLFKGNLIGGKILDSLKIVQLVASFNDEFDIEITPIDIVPEKL